MVIPVWVLKDMIKTHQDYQIDARSLGRRRAANEQLGKWTMLNLIVNDETWLEAGRQMLAEIAAARIKPPCHHVWIDVTLNEDTQKGMKRKLCQVCGEVVLEAII